MYQEIKTHGPQHSQVVKSKTQENIYYYSQLVVYVAMQIGFVLFVQFLSELPLKSLPTHQYNLICFNLIHFNLIN